MHKANQDIFYLHLEPEMMQLTPSDLQLQNLWESDSQWESRKQILRNLVQTHRESGKPINLKQEAVLAAACYNHYYLGCQYPKVLQDKVDSALKLYESSSNCKVKGYNSDSVMNRAGPIKRAANHYVSKQQDQYAGPHRKQQASDLNFDSTSNQAFGEFASRQMRYRPPHYPSDLPPRYPSVWDTQALNNAPYSYPPPPPPTARRNSQHSQNRPYRNGGDFASRYNKYRYKSRNE